MDRVTPAEARYIVNTIRNHSGVDLSGYAMANLRLVLSYFTRTKGIRYSDILINRLIDFPEQLDELLAALDLPDLEMFRDPEFWQMMKEILLPHLLEKNKPLRIWLPHNTSGEELFSLLVCLHEITGPEQYEITAGNISTIRQKSASAGILTGQKFETSRLNYGYAGGQHNFADYFIEMENQYHLRLPGLLNVRFHIHSPVPELPEEKYDLILIRNRLLQFTQPVKEQIVQVLAAALEKTGLLILGFRENLNGISSLLYPSEHYYNDPIFKLKG